MKEDYDHLRTERLDLQEEDFLPEYFVKDAPTYKRNPIAINLPWLINGAPTLALQSRFMGE